MCTSCNWETALNKIDNMLEDDNYDFAEDTLEGIADWITQNEHITSKQLEAIDNILNSKE